MPKSNPAGAGLMSPEYAERYEAERARWLRRRFLWYCGVVGALVILSIGINVVDAFVDPLAEANLRIGSMLDLVGDGLLFLLFGGAFALVAWRPLDRRGLVTVASWLIVLSATVTMLVEPTTSLIYGTAFGETVTADEQAVLLGGAGLFGAFLMHFMGSAFIAMTPREALRPLVPLTVVFALVALTLYPGSLAVRGTLIALMPLAGLPGLLWSWSRQRKFDERFRSRMMQGRLGEMTIELAYARRIHEALFPPPVTRGAIQVRYRYEPMREIGGDFLFIQPLAFPPSRTDGPVSIVLLDVSGHGIPAALAVNRLHGELTRFFAAHPTGSPGELLRALNGYASAALAPQSVYATGLCLRFDPARNTVEYASGGHPPAFLRRSSGEMTPLGATAVMLGVVGDELFVPGEVALPFEDGDLLVAYTDGASEARREGADMFSIERIRDFVERHAAVPDEPGRVTERLMEAVRDHRRGAPTDDTLIVEVQFRSEEATVGEAA